MPFKDKERNNAYYNEYHKRNPTKRWAAMIKFCYGLLPEDYERMLEEQGHCCAICKGQQNSLSRYFDVDHDHVSNKVRGLLCNRCNQGLAKFKDNPESLILAADYLRKYG